MLTFRGTGGEHPRRNLACGVSPAPLLPQESRTFRSNQLLYHQFALNNNLLEKNQKNKQRPFF
jgi:hypothetical protein